MSEPDIRPDIKPDVATDPDPDPPDLPTRTELRLRERAAVNRWDVPEPLRVEALYQLGLVLLHGSKRAKLAAARVLAVLTRIDQADDKLQIERSKLDPPGEAEARDAWDDVCSAVESAPEPDRA